MFKKKGLILLLLCFSVWGISQTRITIEDPAEWVASDLSPYVGQTVTFATPMYVCNNYYYNSGRLSISPRRIYSPTNQAIPLSEEYETIVSLNNDGMVTLTGINGYHRMGEKILNLTVKVNSTSSVSAVGTPVFAGNYYNKSV